MVKRTAVQTEDPKVQSATTVCLPVLKFIEVHNFLNDTVLKFSFYVFAIFCHYWGHPANCVIEKFKIHFTRVNCRIYTICRVSW